MKDVFFLIFLIILVFSHEYFGQTIDNEKSPEITKVNVADSLSKIINKYHISCYFLEDLSDYQYKKAINISNWIVKSLSGKYYSIYEIKKTPIKNKIFIEGDFEPINFLTLTYIGEGNQRVNIKTNEVEINNSVLKIGEGQGIDLSFQRIASEACQFTVDYKAKIDLIGNYYSIMGKNFYFKSYSLTLKSNGALSNSSLLRNGTQTSMEISAIPYFYSNQLIYRNELHLGYQLETKMDSTYFSISNKCFKIGAIVEVPYTNYPMFYLHQYTKYLRMAMPLIVEVNYYPKGKDNFENITLARWDLSFKYELAFSRYLIIRGEWNYTKFLNSPVGLEDKKYFTAITFAQDLIVLRDYLGVLKYIFGLDNVEDKNFIYYKIESGCKAPNFQNVNQQSIGVGVYF